MKVERHDGSHEREILIGMIVSKSVLGPIALHWDELGLFDGRWANLIGGWTVRHYKKYRKAPGDLIESIFDRWAERGKRNKDTVELAEKFLESLSGQYERQKKKINPEYTLDLAATYFNQVKMKEMVEEINGLLSAGEIDKAEKRRQAFRRVEIGQRASVPVFEEEASVLGAFEKDTTEDLVTFPGALGQFYKRQLARDCFVAFEGMTKVGKSFFLMDMAWRGVKQSRRVAFIETGDMSQSQVLRRLGARAARRPIYGDKDHAVKIPISMDSGNPPTVEYREDIFPGDLTGEQAWEAIKKVGRRVGEDLFRMAVYPNRTITARGIEELVERWVDEGWTPDVIVIDYADLLAPMNGKIETRDQINETWQHLRSMNQKLHCLLVVGTQGDAGSYNKQTLDRSNFSGARQKNDHVTSMIGINQKNEEKEAGLYRLNFIVGRDLEFGNDRCCWCASCLPLANPCCRSTF